MRAMGRAFDLLFPPACVVCGTGLDPGTDPLCRLCRHRLPALAAPRCGRCGATRRLQLPASPGCVECAEWGPEIPKAGAPCRMEGGAARLVHALKFGGWRKAARPMAAEITSITVGPGITSRKLLAITKASQTSNDMRLPRWRRPRSFRAA